MSGELETIEDSILRAKRKSEAATASSSVADQPPTSITSDTEAKGAGTHQTTSSPSAESTTKEDMEFTGEEPIAFVLTLTPEKRVKWVLERLSAFQEAVVNHAEACQRERQSGKSISESEWQATLETEGLVRAVPNEQEVYKWILASTPTASS